jgi:hypothetical protein
MYLMDNRRKLLRIMPNFIFSFIRLSTLLVDSEISLMLLSDFLNYEVIFHCWKCMLFFTLLPLSMLISLLFR